MEDCKRCLLLESSKEDVLKDIVEHIKNIPAKDRSPKELYQKRLDACRQCNNLISGTCIKCGCYVEFRAAFLKQKCPDAGASKW